MRTAAFFLLFLWPAASGGSTLAQCHLNGIDAVSVGVILPVREPLGWQQNEEIRAKLNEEIVETLKDHDIEVATTDDCPHLDIRIERAVRSSQVNSSEVGLGIHLSLHELASLSRRPRASDSIVSYVDSFYTLGVASEASERLSEVVRVLVEDFSGAVVAARGACTE